jgi:sugar phosphate isomerase/epimerase
VEEFNINSNPIFKNPQAIRDESAAHGIAVPSLCADYLMHVPLHPGNTKSWALFELLLTEAKNVGVQVVVVPCVDNSTLMSPENRQNLEESLPRMLRMAEECSILIALETDLDPTEFTKLLSKFPSPSLTVNYDSGNSASLGYDFLQEMEAYGERISDFHLKDRALGGGTVELGTGAANFSEILSYLLEPAFEGIVTMQAMRDKLGPPSALQQFQWIQEMILPPALGANH